MHLNAFCNGVSLWRLITKTKSETYKVRKGSKTFRIMKLTAFLLVIALHMNAAGLSQITLSEKNAPLEKIFKTIEEQSGYVFFFKYATLQQAKAVSIKVRNAQLTEVLNECFKDQPLTYSIIGKTVVIKEKETVKPGVENTDENAFDKKIEISGTITDMAGNPLAGATVKLKETDVTMVADQNGSFRLSSDKSYGVLVISFVGYEAKEVSFSGAGSIKISLKQKETESEDVVVIGYGAQKKKSLTGSVATVKGEEITVAPLASTANTLAGRLPGLISLQSSGQPGADAAALSIRGFGNALVIVDGIEASFNNIDPNSIETISILKDGAASIYGSRAGNGVILVTTKRGKNQKPVLTLNSSYTLQGITTMPKPASAGQYAEMKSEAWLESGKPAASVPYTPEQIKKYYDGTDPLYPNTDWYNVLVRKWAPQHQTNLSVRGGSDKIKYYGFIGYLNQGSIWKINGGDYSRYNLQSNIDAKITDDLSLQLDIATIVESRKSTWRPQNAGGNTVWQDFWNTLPIYPATLPDPTKISFANGGGTGGAHVVTNRDIAGYNNYDNQNIRGTISLNYNVSAVKGLSAKAFVNVLQDYGTSKNFSKPVKFYTYDPASSIYTLAGSLGSQASLNMSKNEGRIITGQFSLNYNRIFNNIHHISVLGLYEAIDYTSDFLSAGRVNFLTPAIEQLFGGSTNGMSNDGAASEMGRKSYVGRFNYSFKNKYLIETSIRADASAKFPADNRWGYFPSISVGWNLSQESFMQHITGVDNFKLRASFGASGNDGVGNFQYLSGYQYGSTYVFGGNAQPSLISTGLANPNLTWEKIKIYNAGADFSFWNRKLYGELDLFYRTRNGIPATRATTLPSSFGSLLPPENLNSLNDRGFDLRIGTAGHAGDLSWDLNANFSSTRSKWDHFEEPAYQDPIQAQIYQQSGRWTDRTFGYVSDGLFTSMNEISKLKFNQDGQNNVTLKPGDIKYVDINGDGILNWKDQVEIGKGTVPHQMLGINGNLKFRNFDFSVLFQGAFGYYNYIVLKHAELSPVEFYNERWTEANNNPNALVPRLGGAATNQLPSDYYYKKSGYLRLKVVSFGYNLPKKMLQAVRLTQLRLFATATNILTFDKLGKYGTDPEAPSGNTGYYYPQQKTITFGINLSL